MGYYGYPASETVAEKKANALKKYKKLLKKDKTIQPVFIEGRTLALSWWGKAWNKNLESYADYNNRLSRGKSYVKHNSILDLKINQGKIMAKINGSKSKIYEVAIHLDELDKVRWAKILKLCNHEIDSLEALVEGKFPKTLEILFTDKTYGLFPSSKEIHFDCSCPDYASMCKHVAATLYGVGSRLDLDPLVFFKLRGVDFDYLIKKSVEDKLESMLLHAGRRTNRTISDNKISDIFGL